ncbi:DUF3800 domain-containing protein [Candidatus Uabimicrobium sp. HlEnr_7]|uniref:DUF3800 domain-containing protein n=1 Tax=Candidatus Uabimicrobium helgolandensis TaxID=3095367 RepID=UPI003555BF23
MNIFLYLDASGQSTDTRLWGVLTVLGQCNNSTMESIIKNFSHNCENFHELKSKSLSTDKMKEIIIDIQQQTHAHFYCQRFAKENYRKKREAFLIKLKSLHFSQGQNAVIQFYSRLKKTNQVKFMCLLETIENALQKLSKNVDVDDIHIFIDDENFPPGKDLVYTISDYVYATWKHPTKKNTKNKTVYTLPACDSQKVAGIQAIDLFLGYVCSAFDYGSNVFIDL